MSARNRCFSLMLAGVALAGCQDLMLRIQDPEAFDRKVSEEKAIEAIQGKEGHAKLLGDYISVSGFTSVAIEGVGLVTGLDGTGEDVQPSQYRTMLLEDMKKHRIKDPNSVLRSKNTALVLVRAILPPLIKKGEKFDVEIFLPDGSKTTSLAGGWLMEVELKEHANVPGGGVREGRMLGKAKGPILVTAGMGKVAADAGSLRHGTIPGGATYVGHDNRNLMAMVRSDYRSAKLTHRVAKRIGERFHDYDEHGLQKPMANATTDRKIELIVPDKYRDNYPRYLQVIRNMTLRETPVERHLRIQELRDDLRIPEKAELAALQLEAEGSESIPILRDGLRSSTLECRFRAAEALAYLGEADGVEALKEAAANEPAFRVFALAAMSTLDDGRAFNALVELMDHESVETRYGAFRALTTANPDDPNVKGRKMPGEFSLHVVKSDAPPLIHLTRWQKAEIVLFGENQRFTTPLMIRAGQRIIVQNTGNGTAKVSRIAPGETPQTREVSTRVGDVILACSEMDASYPDIVQLLVEAQLQGNLPGRIGIDDLPQAGRVYRRPRETGEAEEVPIGVPGAVPNIFQNETKPDAALAPDVTGETVEAAPETDEPKTPDPVAADLDAKPVRESETKTP